MRRRNKFVIVQVHAPVLILDLLQMRLLIILIRILLDCGRKRVKPVLEDRLLLLPQVRLHFDLVVKLEDSVLIDAFLCAEASHLRADEAIELLALCSELQLR